MYRIDVYKRQILDEVVVVGYGVQKKESLTGAIAAMGADEIATNKTENLISNIRGKMPGLLMRKKTGEPGTFYNMVSIRGYGDPLVVIDGITREGTEELAPVSYTHLCLSASTSPSSTNLK